MIFPIQYNVNTNIQSVAACSMGDFFIELYCITGFVLRWSCPDRDPIAACFLAVDVVLGFCGI